MRQGLDDSAATGGPTGAVTPEAPRLETSLASATSPRALPTNSLIAQRYRLLRELDRGTLGPVFCAEDTLRKRAVALKQIDAAKLGRTDLFDRVQARIWRNSQVAARSRGPVVPGFLDVVDVGHERDSVFVVMDLIPGHDLARVLASRGPLPWPLTRALLLGIADRLEAAHARHITAVVLRSSHCFLAPPGESPAVVVLNSVLDELACLEPQVGSSAIASEAMHYAAPELLSGGAADIAGDLYSLGVLAHELLTGHRPFEHEDPARLRAMHLTADPPPLDETRVPAAVSRVLARLLAKRPGDRFADVASLREALSAADPRPEDRGVLFSAARTLQSTTDATPPAVDLVPPPSFHNLPSFVPNPSDSAESLRIDRPPNFDHGAILPPLVRGLGDESSPALRLAPETTEDVGEEEPESTVDVAESMSAASFFNTPDEVDATALEDTADVDEATSEVDVDAYGSSAATLSPSLTPPLVGSPSSLDGLWRALAEEPVAPALTALDRDTGAYDDADHDDTDQYDEYDEYDEYDDHDTYDPHDDEGTEDDETARTFTNLVSSSDAASASGVIDDASALERASSSSTDAGMRQLSDAESAVTLADMRSGIPSVVATAAISGARELPTPDFDENLYPNKTAPTRAEDDQRGFSERAAWLAAALLGLIVVGGIAYELSSRDSAAATDPVAAEERAPPTDRAAQSPAERPAPKPAPAPAVKPPPPLPHPASNAGNDAPVASPSPEGVPTSDEPDAVEPTEDPADPPDAAPATTVDPPAPEPEKRTKPSPRRRPKKPAPKDTPPSLEPPEAEPEAEPEPAPAKPRKTLPKNEAMNLLAEARKASVDGRVEEAYRLARESYRTHKTTEALLLVGVTACKLGKADKARAVLKKLPSAQRKPLRTLCGRVGVELAEG